LIAQTAGPGLGRKRHHACESTTLRITSLDSRDSIRVEAAPRLAQGVIQKKISHGESRHKANVVAWHARDSCGYMALPRIRGSARRRRRNPGIIGISEEQGAAARGAAQLHLPPKAAHHRLRAPARQARHWALFSPLIERES